MAMPVSTSKGWSTPRYRRAKATDADDDGADDLGDRPRPPGHDERVDDADDGEADDGERRRRQRVALPPADGRDVVRARPRVRLDQQQTPRSRGRSTLARNVNRWRQRRKTIIAREQHSGDDEHRPAGRRPIDGPEHLAQPLDAQPGDRPQDRRVDLVGDAPRPRRHAASRRSRRRARPRPTSQPLPGRTDAPRQRRSAPGRPSPAPRSVAPSAGRTVARAGTVELGRSVCSLVVTAAPPIAATPRRWPRRRRCRASSASAALSVRSVVGVERTRTRASMTSTTPGPHRSTTSRRISGVTFSAGCSRSIVDELDVVRERRIGGEQQGHVDAAAAQRGVRHRAARVERDDLGEPQPVALSQPERGTADALGTRADHRR